MAISCYAFYLVLERPFMSHRLKQRQGAIVAQAEARE